MPKALSFMRSHQWVEPYRDVKMRIQAAIELLQMNPFLYSNIAEIAPNQEILGSPLWALLQGCYNIIVILQYFL